MQKKILASVLFFSTVYAYDYYIDLEAFIGVWHGWRRYRTDIHACTNYSPVIASATVDDVRFTLSVSVSNYPFEDQAILTIVSEEDGKQQKREEAVEWDKPTKLEIGGNQNQQYITVTVRKSEKCDFCSR